MLTRALLALSLLAPMSASAAGSRVEDLVRESLQPRIDAREIAGATVAVVRGDATEFFYLGLANVAESRPVEAGTLFEIGSITKTFTGVVLAQMVQENLVTLDTPVQDLLPPGRTMPTPKERPITLRDLTTHTSGLPRMPSNFAPRNPQHPYIDYTEDSLYAFLQGYTLPRAPGVEMEYSNLATALLGHVLGLKAEGSYEAALRKRVLEPLGMQDTWLNLAEADQARLAQGYRSGRQFFVRQVLQEQGRWDFDVFRAAGGLRATIGDMAIYLRANIVPEATPLSAALRAAHSPLYTVDPSVAVGMNWIVATRKEDGRVAVWHNGETGAFHSFLAFDPARREGVVILANTATDIDAQGWKILDGLRGVAAVTQP